MSVIGYRRLVVVLAAVAGIELAILWRFAWRDAHARWDARNAQIAVRRIEGDRHTALDGTPEVAVGVLKELTVSHTPWRWQREDLRFGELVERLRDAAVEDIVEDLRRKTGKDLGNAAPDWIQDINTSDTKSE
jgi:hypothetical protein